MSGIFGTFCNSIHTQDKNKKKLILWNNALKKTIYKLDVVCKC